MTGSSASATMTTTKIDDGSDDGLGAWAIVGIAAAGIVFIVLFVSFILYCKGRGKESNQRYSAYSDDAADR